MIALGCDLQTLKTMNLGCALALVEANGRLRKRRLRELTLASLVGSRYDEKSLTKFMEQLE